jgi:arsenate reductase
MTTQFQLFEEIRNTIEKLQSVSISKNRKEILQPLRAYVQSKALKEEQIRINFICTHNSRRSHLSQIWAQTIAAYFGVKNVSCYSGGTEATALFPKVVETLRGSGFQIECISDAKNPIYSIKFAANTHPIIGFSKKLDDDFNPKSRFAAVLTCDSANEACPLVVGAEIRIPITFEDPKAFDNTPQQSMKYQERSLQIAAELYHVFSQINS